MDIQHNGKTYDEADLLPLGDRVSPEAIADGLMTEIAVNFNGEERHLPLITVAGMGQIKADYEAEGIRDRTAAQPQAQQSPDTIIIVDDNGMPTGSMNVSHIQNDATDLAFALAATCGNEPETERILAGQILRHSTHGLALVLVAAIKHLTNDILAGAFDFMEATPGLKPREKMAEIGATPVQEPSA